MLLILPLLSKETVRLASLWRRVLDDFACFSLDAATGVESMHAKPRGHFRTIWVCPQFIR